MEDGPFPRVRILRPSFRYRKFVAQDFKQADNNNRLVVKESLNILGSRTVFTDKRFIVKEYLAASHDNLAIGDGESPRGVYGFDNGGLESSGEGGEECLGPHGNSLLHSLAPELVCFNHVIWYINRPKESQQSRTVPAIYKQRHPYANTSSFNNPQCNLYLSGSCDRQRVPRVAS